ncbi:aminomethyl-transferring glycine dehydrogenase [Kocuria rhizophila]|uniref:aminomethyl-transferring glycine dehydrogenase n=1 Tax=Kocuria rhizophila TaxID=72000 RepID=UPI000EF18BEF|nr:aminomethyl-transferring glycine dehydrogenase [Kocuria rhizophila]MCG7424012.1 aminomethyl-transferring glycine dehydrogenase [Kocuria rhizophila]RLP60590.1 glycine dehydrogenase (aminomethyl-transferring) [Kocuria rhizophila]
MSFLSRHIGPDADDLTTMLGAVGAESLDQLIDRAVPESIRMRESLDLPEPLDEPEALSALRRIASRNTVMRQMIGQGYHDTVTPAAIRRNILENPGFYTSYTPYQPEISQGRLELLLTFQNAVIDLTGLEVANASLLDESSAVAEAVLMMRRANRRSKSMRVLVDSRSLPQTLAVLTGRTRAAGIELVLADLGDPDAAAQAISDGDFFGVVVAQIGADGDVTDPTAVIEAAHEAGSLVSVSTDLLALTMLRSPGEMGADIAVGSAQRFGVPLFFGGPHAAFLASRKGTERSLPGRIVGVSTDSSGAPAYRLALQTREQHIRREKATSNICTAQALLAIVAAAYAVHHGPVALRALAERLHGMAADLAAGLRARGIEVAHERFFDTVTFSVPGQADAVVAAAADRGYNLRRVDGDTVGVSFGEPHTDRDVVEVLTAVTEACGAAEGESEPGGSAFELPEALLRTDEYLTHPVFHTHRSETSLMRWLRELSDKDLALDRTMIPLGSCTMKLNAAAEMEPISWPEFASIHPLAPEDQTRGWTELIEQLQGWLAEITGYAAVSVQPNAGSQGELAGLLAIRRYQVDRGEHQRKTILIPSSAHGTNAASAVLADLKVVVVATAQDGTIDQDDLRAKIDSVGDELAGIMVTYPSTHGVYDTDITEVCAAVHDAGGQVYVDGANLNALMGLARPGRFGGDVSHLNLHKTFCIPHGGGGPGVGPVAVAEHLVPYLPGNPATADLDERGAGFPVAQAPHGSAGVLPITWMYIAMTGAKGLTESSRTAVLGANYISRRLSDVFPTLYTGDGGLVAHECILDLRPMTKASGVTAEDVCKRLVDFGFHAPTLAFPVAGTLMVEPTESEGIEELDRFIEAMRTIHAEMQEIADGKVSLEESVIRHAPHTAQVLTADDWDRSYSRSQAGYPVSGLRRVKYWPPVGRIDNAAGDRNLVCECPPIEAFDAAHAAASGEEK